MSFDVDAQRAQFPLLQRLLNGKPLSYLDNAATTQKPNAVIAAIVAYYTQCNANVHRAAHGLATEATDRFEAARFPGQHFALPRHEHTVGEGRAGHHVLDL